MEKYNIIQLNDGDFDYLVIANTYENPINDFLANEEVPGIMYGNIVFDLALINGFKSNRYVSAKVRNNKMDISSIKPICNVNDEVLNASKDYFNTNALLVQNSFLPNAVKYLLVNS